MYDISLIFTFNLHIYNLFLHTSPYFSFLIPQLFHVISVHGIPSRSHFFNSIFILSPFCVLQLCLPLPAITNIYYLCTTSHSISVQRTSLYASFSFKIFVILFLQLAFLIHLKSTVFHLCAWPFFHCECLTFFYLICFIFPPEFYRCYISSWYFSYFLLLILYLF